MHKKKNLVNSFLREYEGRFVYETLGCGDIEEVKEFHENGSMNAATTTVSTALTMKKKVSTGCSATAKH